MRGWGPVCKVERKAKVRKRLRGANGDERVYVAEHNPSSPQAALKRRRMDPQPSTAQQLLLLPDHIIRRTRKRTGSPQIQERVVRVDGLTVTQAMLLDVPVTRTKRAKYEAKHLIYDVRNKHIAIEEEVPDPGAVIPLDDAAEHDRARKAAHDT